MKVSHLFFGFYLLSTIFGISAKNCRALDRGRGNRVLRRYRPRTGPCRRCRPEHRNLLLHPATASRVSKLKNCLSVVQIRDPSTLRAVLPTPSPETFALVLPVEDFLLRPEILSEMAEVLGNVSVLLPADVSDGTILNKCTSLGQGCQIIGDLRPVLQKFLRKRQHENFPWEPEPEPEPEIEAEWVSLDGQFEKFASELCKRNKTGSRFIEILEGTGSDFLSKDDDFDDLKFGLSLKDILPVDSKSYDKNRPPKTGGRPTIVYFHVTVLSLDSINEESMTYVADIFLAQSWRDSRLRLPENMSEQYRILDVDWLHDIWRPDCFFKNAKQVTFHEISIPNHYVWLYQDKTLLYMSKYLYVTYKSSFKGLAS